MGAGVLLALVEADPCDRAVGGGLELDPKLHRVGIVRRYGGGRIAGIEKALRGYRVVHRERHVGRGRGLAVSDCVREAGWSEVIIGRRETDRLCARVVTDSAIARIADAYNRQR